MFKSDYTIYCYRSDNMKNVIMTIAAIVAVTVLGVGSILPASEYSHGPRIKDKNGNSLNWAGYAVTGSAGSVTDVKGSWTVPAVTCPGGSQYSSFWVGIDGYSSSTVEQIGIDSDCSNGNPVYYAWYEFYPKPSFRINSMAINPGDNISAEVKYTGRGQFTVSIKDVNTTASFSKSAKVNSAQMSSAEWIAEAPWSGGVLPLADFDTAYFGLDNTGVPSTNNATVNGNNGNMGSFGSSVPITMVTSLGAVKAQPSSVSSDGTSFSVQWFSS
jgi:hypothetical protein